MASLLLAAIVSMACGSARPVATPADAQSIFGELARRGGSVTEIVAGETGCGDPGLVANAIRFRLTSPGMREPATVHLFIFRNRSSFEAAADAVERCKSIYAATEPDVDSVAVGTYRAFGAGWPRELRALLESTLAELAGPG
jgi:glycine/D-amino acid oxidase-like deaminating enzyme